MKEKNYFSHVLRSTAAGDAAPAPKTEAEKDPQSAAAAQQPKPPVLEPNKPQDETETVLAEDAVIIGSLKTNGGLQILGAVKGDVTARGSLGISGRVVGRVEAEELQLSGGAIKGNVVCRGGMMTAAPAVVLGDVQAKELTVQGRIKGDLHVEQSVVLCREAIVAGNVYAGNIQMASGAKVQGQLHITSQQANDDCFEEAQFEVEF